MENKVDIGVFGGSGFYSFLKNVKEIEVNTPYGMPSDKIAIAEYEGKRIAFLPRHGKNHQYPPHKIPYRANVYAMKQLGVSRIIAPTASGSLKANIKPGDFVICDQFIDRTWGRSDTYYDGPETKHFSSANPYCKELRELAIETSKSLGITTHEKGTVIVIQGPRFSTKAESKWYRNMGCDVINMTQYPECYLAKEMNICYVNISLITDFDAGLEGCEGIEPVTEEEVFRVFEENNEKLKKVLFEMIRKMDCKKECNCGGV
ncbi:S-methyl-5'-thioadenosine phosphorylase [Ruminiclostridium herbifermentans]|uniref:Purine nucleoside phosphorylase n=1 Tax=Ruminiclostridium herbifermentans TaxID=2488810 RepID=A0A4U7JHA3_9FIRM|nr:S-methyl-5'-thioadenosine phosphorylase [Ruminiclostridium herbifermentans]QNU66068.1 S-methyl-5'-thioadenosine phosphorylase [Ruminiclostridium herbifermentans]